MKSLRRTVFQAAGVACLLAAGSSLSIHADDPPGQASPNSKADRVIDLDRESIPIKIGTSPQADLADAKDFMLGHSLRRAWSVKVASNNPRSPGAAEGIVVAGSGRSDKIYGFDTVSGRRLWTAKSKDSGISSISVERKGAYYTTKSCTLERIDIYTGKIDFVEWLAPSVNCGPDVKGDMVAAAYYRDGNYRVSMHTADKGKRKWIESVETKVISAPVIHGDSVFAARTDGKLVSLSAKKGKQNWTVKAGSLSAPVATKWGLLFATSWNGETQPTAANGKKEMTEAERRRYERQTTTTPNKKQEYRTVAAAKDRRIAVLDDPSAQPKEGEVKMPAGPRRHGLDYQGLRPGVSENHVLFAHAGSLAVVDPLSAAESWQVELKDSKTEWVQPVSTEGLVIIAGNTGHVAAFEEDTGALIWAYRIDGRSFTSAPAAYDGRVFLTSTQGELISLPLGVENFTTEKNPDDAEAKSDKWWKVQKAFKHVRDIIKDPAKANKLPDGEQPADQAGNGNSPDADDNPARPADRAVRRDDEEEAEPDEVEERLTKGQWERREERKAKRRTAPNGKPYEKKPYRRDR